jgi:type II secretory pathway pseudopilin PulG
MRRGFVLIAVLVVIAAAILVATGAIFAARGAVQGSQAADLERRLRDAALDGVALAAESLASQREAVLAGATPKVEAELLRVSDGPRQIEVRLVPLANGQLVQSEAAKLDVNETAPAVLAKPVESGSEVARQIVESMAARRPNSSVDAATALVPVARCAPRSARADAHAR